MFRCLAIAALASSLTTAALADDRPAAAILDELKAITLPDRPDVRDGASLKAYLAAMSKAREQRAPLILELFRSHPDHPELTRLLPVRWQDLVELDRDETLPAEADDAVARRPEDVALRVEAAYIKAFRINVRNSRSREKDIAGGRAAMDAFTKLSPGDPRAVRMFGNLMVNATGDERRAIADRILKDYPDSPQAKDILAQRRGDGAIGQPFVLEFTDAITGQAVSVQETLKGKVIVVDFWATWCGPCIAEMPKMKALYARYKDQGVEFLGVSLDEPEETGKGLTKLKAFVAKNEIAWPQYYQGNGSESEFSASWGLTGIPEVFLIGADGKLVTKDALGKLDTLIPEQLRKAKAKARD